MSQSMLVIEARRLEKLLAKRRIQARYLKVLDIEIKLVRKHIKGLMSPKEPNPLDPDDQLPPSMKGKAQ
jgi:hypothetical protein